MIGQDSFTIVNGSVIWQKVYNEGHSIENLSKNLKTGPFTEIVSEGDILSADMIELTLDSKGAGMRAMTTPFYISGSSLSGKVVIDIKEDRYRVTVTNMVLTQMSDVGIFKQGDKSSLESMILAKRNTKFKGGFTKSHYKVFDYTFDKLFIVTDTGDDW